MICKRKKKKEKKRGKKRFLHELITKTDLKSNDFHVIIVKKYINQCLMIILTLKKEKKEEKRVLLESITEK